MKKVIIYTDGACSGNPGQGGWGAVIIYNEHVKEISGYEEYSTNNKMELLATIESMKTLKEKCEVDIYTDSVYVKNGITSWIINWKKNNWKTSNKQDVKNKELWILLDEQCSRHLVQWHWVRGHSNNELNNRADFLATNAIKNVK